MEQEEQGLHLTIVTDPQRSRRSFDGEGDRSSRHRSHSEHYRIHHGEQDSARHSTRHGERDGACHSTHHGERHGAHSGTHHGERHRDNTRHHQNFGTVNLGSLDRVQVRPDEAAPREQGSRGREQREFYDRYTPVLNRRYRTQNRAKLLRGLLIAGVVALAFLVSAIFLTSLTDREAPITPQSTLEPIPQVDLNDL